MLEITIMSCFAQAESESISKNVSWGVRQSFKNGNVPMQYAKLLGYRKGEDGLPKIIPEEAEIVKEIFRSYLDGMSLKRIAELAHNIDELIKLATLPETAQITMSDIEKFSEEMKTLREFIETERAKQMTAQRGSAKLDAILERLENEDFTMTEYDDVAVRQLIEKVTAESKYTITVTFKGGFGVMKELNGD